ncbi:MAG: aldose 1-epimerase family protein [Planctomycetia bacterium]|nr:aldose 1-epimerase family protein [Planctomycetia bacterium]
MAQKTWILTDAARDIHEPDFMLPPGAAGEGVSVTRRALRGGLREGVDAIEIDNGKFRFVVVPTRGMGLWKGWLHKTEIGWRSPIQGPVHPQFVPLTEPSGLGWLEGFDELMVRCGLESNGAPDSGPNGVYKYPLHGRIANRPAHYVQLAADADSGEISLSGLVDETRFLFQKLRLKSTYKTKIGQSGLRIIDEVTNLSGDPAEMQLLYHVNIGAPILDPGARVVAPVKTIVPRDARATEGIGTWDSYPNERAGYKEQVYFFELLAGSDGRTQVLLKNAHGTQGVSVRYNKAQLPYFTLWKNTPMAADGYVTGLEPGTNFPNPRTFEKEQGRVIVLKPGASVHFDVTLDVHATAQDVSAAEGAIAKIQAGTGPKVHSAPQAGWTKIG